MKSVILSLLIASCFVSSAFADPIQNGEEAVGAESKKPDEKKKTENKKKSEDKKKVDDGDTYNFYFQKGSGPGTVQQGGGQPGPSGGGTPEAKSISPTDKLELPRFEGHLGLVMLPGRSGLGLSLGGQFNATPNFGLQVHLLGLDSKDKDGDSSMSASGMSETSTKESSMGASVAVAYSPLTLNQEAKPIRLSAVGGFMFLNTSREETKHDMSAYGSNDSTTTKHDSKGLAFVGVSGLAMLSKSFGLVGYGHITSDPDYSHIGLSAAWLF